MSQLEALGLTIAIEAIVALALLLGARWVPRAELGRTTAMVAAASLLSHPLAWQANTVWLRALPFAERAAVIELAVAVVETVVLAFGLRLGWWRAAVVAFAANAASFALGLWLARWW